MEREREWGGDENEDRKDRGMTGRVWGLSKGKAGLTRDWRHVWALIKERGWKNKGNIKERQRTDFYKDRRVKKKCDKGKTVGSKQGRWRRGEQYGDTIGKAGPVWAPGKWFLGCNRAQIRHTINRASHSYTRYNVPLKITNGEAYCRHKWTCYFYTEGRYDASSCTALWTSLAQYGTMHSGTVPDTRCCQSPN
jgi:hypothetical protein